MAPTDALETVVEGFINDGATSVVVQARWPGGEWSKAYGRRDPQHAEPAQPADRFSVGSLTKSMVAVAVLQLVDEGAIGLDDPVNKLLESFQHTLKPPAAISVRQLLNHTSGMPDFVDLPERVKSPKDLVLTTFSMQQSLELAATVPWDWRKVGFFSYSNSNYLALGQLLEKLDARPLHEVLETRIFQPLGLTKTTLNKTDRDAPDNLRAYVTVGAEQIEVTQGEFVLGSPAGGVVSNTENVNTFYRALLSGKLVSPTSLKQMKTVKSNYGLGLMRFPDQCSPSSYRYGHHGALYGYLTLAISNDDGSRQVTIGMVLPTLPIENQDTAAARRIDQYQSQMELAAQKALDQMCN